MRVLSHVPRVASFFHQWGVRLYLCCMAMAAGLGLVLLAIRAFSAISFSEPLQLWTSGSEEESLFGVWSVIHNDILYRDRLDVPYSVNVYNWLFFHAYAGIDILAAKAFALGDSWLPTISRLMTLAGACVGGVAAYATLRRVLGRADFAALALAIGFAIYALSGPLIGWWALTARSDIWALAFEILGCLGFLGLYPRHPMRAVIVLIIFAYGAWAFKQTNITLLVAALAFLLVRKEWRLFVVLAGVMFVAFGITLWIGGEKYINSIFMVGWKLKYSVDHALSVTLNFLIKATPAVMGFVAVILCFLFSPTWRAQLLETDAFLLSLCGVVPATLFTPFAVAQSGAAENYFLALNWFLVLGCVAGLSLLFRPSNASMFPVFTLGLLGWVLSIGALVLVLSGYRGKLSQRETHVEFVRYKACVDQLPRPIFFTTPYFGLPWMTPGSIPFVFSWFYREDWRDGKRFQEGGFAGLVIQGKIAAVVDRSAPWNALEVLGVTNRHLESYRRVSLPGCEALIVYMLDRPPAPERRD